MEIGILAVQLQFRKVLTTFEKIYEIHAYSSFN